MDDHNIQGRAIVPGAGWLALIAHEAGTSKLADVAFMRGVFEPDTTIRVVKRRRLMQATAGEETILKASLVSGDAAPETIGPDVFGRGVALGSPSKKKPARGKENGVADNGVARVGTKRRFQKQKRRGRQRRQDHRRLQPRAALPPVLRPEARVRRRVQGHREGGLVWARVSGGVLPGDAPRRGVGRRASGGVRVRAGQHVHSRRGGGLSDRGGRGRLRRIAPVRGSWGDSRAAPRVSRRGSQVRVRRRGWKRLAGFEGEEEEGRVSSLPRPPPRRPETGCSRRWAAPNSRASRG